MQDIFEEIVIITISFFRHLSKFISNLLQWTHKLDKRSLVVHTTPRLKHHHLPETAVHGCSKPVALLKIGRHYKTPLNNYSWSYLRSIQVTSRQYNLQSHKQYVIIWSMTKKILWLLVILICYENQSVYEHRFDKQNRIINLADPTL